MVPYNPKEIGNVGRKIKKYQLDFRAISKDKLKLLAIKQRLIELLDHQDRATHISDDETYVYKIKLINGGGIAKAENGDYYAFLYFFAII